MEYIIITGANGNLGGKLVKLICDGTDFGAIAVASQMNEISSMLIREQIVCTNKIIAITNNDFISADLNQWNIIGAVHLAFSRLGSSSERIASSIDYCKEVFSELYNYNIGNVIYVSSQGVYGDISNWRKENLNVSPNNIYSMAKYSGEKMLEAFYANQVELRYSSLRLDIVAQSQNLIKTLCKNAIQNNKLVLKGGKQVFSYIDERDVADAVLSLLMRKGDWSPIYNVGHNKMRYNLVEVAEIVKSVANHRGYKVDIVIDKDDTALWAGMDASLFQKDTGWTPKLTIWNMVEDIFIRVESDVKQLKRD